MRLILSFLLSLMAITGLFTVSSQASDRLSPLSARPDWKALDGYQETITREEFLYLLNHVYARGVDTRPFIEVQNDRAWIRTQADRPDHLYELRFASSKAAIKPVPRYWRAARSLPPAPKAKPLAGITIALDPGHIGGDFAKMEERWFQIGNAKPVMEGEMTLLVGRHLERVLQAYGAKVVWVRNSNKPVTKIRPKDLRRPVIQMLKRSRQAYTEGYNGANDPNKSLSVQWQSELLFYRTSEIHARAEKVNQQLRPDITICLHFNAEEWGNPNHPQLVDKNHLHLLVNGSYGRGELSLDDVRFEMLQRLLGRVFPEELAVSESVAASMASATQLPPYIYQGNNAFRVGQGSYVWARNLLANRIYQNPVVFVEPYVMNSQAFHDRIQAGDYEGKRVFNGVPRESIYREYARGVAEGLLNYYRGNRTFQ